MIRESRDDDAPFEALRHLRLECAAFPSASRITVQRVSQWGSEAHCRINTGYIPPSGTPPRLGSGSGHWNVRPDPDLPLTLSSALALALALAQATCAPPHPGTTASLAPKNTATREGAGRRSASGDGNNVASCGSAQLVLYPLYPRSTTSAVRCGEKPLVAPHALAEPSVVESERVSLKRTAPASLASRAESTHTVRVGGVCSGLHRRCSATVSVVESDERS